MRPDRRNAVNGFAACAPAVRARVFAAGVQERLRKRTVIGSAHGGQSLASSWFEKEHLRGPPRPRHARTVAAQAVPSVRKCRLLHEVIPREPCKGGERHGRVPTMRGAEIVMRRLEPG